jgi:dTDP-4-amino-4,6-dideoxygalactose transaminase
MSERTPQDQRIAEGGVRTRLPGQPEGTEWLTVTSPLLPEFEALAPLLEDVLARRWVTNQGHYARSLESELAKYLRVEDLVLITNGTVALDMGVLEAIPDGEVLVTAYSFPATWNLFFQNPRWKAVFVDTDERYCIDPAAVEAAITPRTTAIVAVHPYGFPCEHDKLSAIATKYGLVLYYDAAHVFAERLNGQSIAGWGDLAALSFHATKVFNCLEGGALVGSPTMCERLRIRRNFGLRGEEQVAFGNNGKIDEFRAVVGLLNLPKVAGAIAARKRVGDRYLERLTALGIEEMHLYPEEFNRPGFESNYAYFPVRIQGGIGRDGLNESLKAQGILARRYFFPTAATSPLYREVVPEGSLPHAASASLETLCLPIHHELSESDVEHVIDSVARAFGAKKAT